MSPNAAPATKSHTPTSPNTAPATQNASHDWSASHMKRHLECAEQAKSTSNLSKYCACHAKWISWLIRASYETSFPMRRASKVNLQPQQILRLPRKMNPMINPRHTWNVIYNARSMHSQPPTSPNTAPATKSASSRLQRKLRELLPPIERRFDDNPTTIRGWSEDDPTMKSSSRTRRFGDLTRPILETILYWKIQHFALRLSPKMSRNVVPATKSHTPTSANTAPATQNESHDWSAQILRLARKMHSTLLYSILSWHLFSPGIYSLGIYSLLASILSWHLFSLGIYSLLASIPSWHLFSLGIYSLLASILSWHLFSLGIYSLLASILSWHLFSRHLFSRHLFSLGIYSLGIYSLLASIL